MSFLNRSVLAAVAALSMAATPAFAAETAPKHAHWDYRGHHGVSHWAELEADFAACANGHRQSPIDIRHATPADLPALQFSYQPTSPSIVNNGHTVQVNVPPGQFLTLGEQKFELLQFHFHTPSEERFNGKSSAMVAHLVHRDAEGHLGVVAVLLEPGKQGSAFDAVLEHLPQHAGETITVADFQLDPAALLPKGRAYYDFDGSLTTPPCSEGVHWMVLREPVKVQPRHIKAFRQLYAQNARPVQALYGRDVKVSK